MKRRAFIGLVGGAAAWPLAVRAQQPVGQKRVGILMGTADDADGQERLAGFRQGLQDLNWVEGRNIRFDVRWGAGDAERTKAYATELVGLAPDLILATNTPTARSLKPGATASTTTSSSRTGPGTIRDRAGSTRSTRAWCRAMRWK